MEKKVTTPFGDLRIVASDGYLVYCGWEEDDCKGKCQKILKSLKNEVGGDEKDHRVIEETERQLRQYFSGERREFDIPVRLIGTEFQRRVWEVMVNIPCGSVMTYGELSRMAGCERGARAVANACGANPVSVVVPCHRVVASVSIGGYTGGVKKKERLLTLERGEGI